VKGAASRHTQYGDSLYLLQPNIKDGAGGLRDYHLSTWVMLATQHCSRGIDGFLHLGLLTEQEVVEYRAALDFMWRIRNELHLASRHLQRGSYNNAHHAVDRVLEIEPDHQEAMNLRVKIAEAERYDGWDYGDRWWRRRWIGGGWARPGWRSPPRVPRSGRGTGRGGGRIR